MNDEKRSDEVTLEAVAKFYSVPPGMVASQESTFAKVAEMQPSLTQQEYERIKAALGDVAPVPEPPPLPIDGHDPGDEDQPCKVKFREFL